MNTQLKKQWKKSFSSSSEQLNKMPHVGGLISAFNANIDAVIKLSGKRIEEMIAEYVQDESALYDGQNIIRSKEDVFRGLIRCFEKGIAEEWLITDLEVFKWLTDTLGYGKLQMGGQGGIVANIMAVCGVDPVYVHCSSLPKQQAELFSDLQNLYSVNDQGEIEKAFNIKREKDIPLIHYILEFDKGDSLNVFGKTVKCPKSNRFIATYDPLNFKLDIDSSFIERLSKPDISFNYVILSGYQMLQKTIEGTISGTDRIDHSLKVIEQLRKNNPEAIIHFEIASTQDTYIRKYLVNTVARKVDSIGFNERELIDILEVIGESDLANDCNSNTNSENMFKGMIKVFEYIACPRMQLHMFGLYITLQKKGFRVSPDQNKKGMQLAANIAATKAGTGAIDNKEDLLWSKDKDVSDVGLNELSQLQDYFNSIGESNQILETGFFSNDSYDAIAVPTILIDQPITLVGMGDTISSVSLISAI